MITAQINPDNSVTWQNKPASTLWQRIAQRVNAFTIGAMLFDGGFVTGLIMGAW